MRKKESMIRRRGLWIDVDLSMIVIASSPRSWLVAVSGIFWDIRVVSAPAVFVALGGLGRPGSLLVPIGGGVSIVVAVSVSLSGKGGFFSHFWLRIDRFFQNQTTKKSNRLLITTVF
jgi:hypothetical protein